MLFFFSSNFIIGALGEVTRAMRTHSTPRRWCLSVGQTLESLTGLTFITVNMHLVCTDHGINTSLFFNAGVSLTFLCELLPRLGPGDPLDPRPPLYRIYRQGLPSLSPVTCPCLPWAGAMQAHTNHPKLKL